MKKILYAFLMSLVWCTGVRAEGLVDDTSDPLFLTARGRLLSQTLFDYFENGLRVGQYLNYGVVDGLVVGGNFHYQRDFDGDQNGFSSVDLNALYRVANSADNHLIYDMLGGVKFGGTHRLRSPDFADSVYYLGFRFGQQYEYVTLAATVKSSWIFNNEHGMAFIDFSPDLYLRLSADWKVGIGANLRKATDKAYDEETVGGRIVRQYGRTQYVGHFDYSFEAEKFVAGLKINILF